MKFVDPVKSYNFSCFWYQYMFAVSSRCTRMVRRNLSVQQILIHVVESIPHPICEGHIIRIRKKDIKHSYHIGNIQHCSKFLRIFGVNIKLCAIKRNGQ
ncbi:hypothetical protein JTB14_013080 [Gonioctena quinquepunctata]|nr:hypothetical protein JTB14_013080 [Gonioctena quinquepunctata]